MRQMAARRMTVEEFISWSDGRPEKWELHEGDAVAMAPERARHSLVKAYAVAAFVQGLRSIHGPCRVYADGLAVRINRHRAFRPDMVVVCPAAPPEDKATSTPSIVLEVLSPSTAPMDRGVKLEGYFSLPSLAHYLILDPDRRTVTHYARESGGGGGPRTLSLGALRLDPPGITLDIADLLGPAD